ncbi:hypothetical protein EMCG_04437, partial [[Emmonsia] crescens]
IIIRVQQLSMHLISKLAALALFFAPLTLGAPTENGNPDNLACQAGTYRCKYSKPHVANIEVCSGGRWILSAKCEGECQFINNTPYCV